jgi:hypothetical protein
METKNRPMDYLPKWYIKRIMAPFLDVKWRWQDIKEDKNEDRT